MSGSVFVFLEFAQPMPLEHMDRLAREAADFFQLLAEFPEGCAVVVSNRKGVKDAAADAASRALDRELRP